MARHIGSDGFTTGIPGICPECFAEQTSYPHPEHYYCKHRERLAVQIEGGSETYRDISPENATKLIQEAIELAVE